MNENYIENEWKTYGMVTRIYGNKYRIFMKHKTKHKTEQDKTTPNTAEYKEVLSLIKIHFQSF